MRVELPYGEKALDIDLPDAVTTVVEPSYLSALPNPDEALRDALRNPVAGPPLRNRVPKGATVAVAVCDGTRPQPRRAMLTALLDELDGHVRIDDIVVLVATGTHRGNTADELRRMLGEDLYGRLRVVNHDSRERSALSWCGRLGGNVPTWLNHEWVSADVRITTGFVEPHFFAGFSGGPKLVAPGLAALETVLVLHDARRIGHPMATWGITHGNPVHDDVRAIADATGVTFTFDVILNRDKQITHAFGGDLLPTHQHAARIAKDVAMVSVAEPFDVVVTTNSGYPLDQNLYQAVKGMSAAGMIVREGGTIVCVAECRDGFPHDGSYRSAFRGTASPRDLLSAIEARAVAEPDQWQAQIQAKIQTRAHVAVKTDYLTPAELAEVHLSHVENLTDYVGTALAAAGPRARCCVLPDGPQTVPAPQW